MPIKQDYFDDMLNDGKDEEIIAASNNIANQKNKSVENYESLLDDGDDDYLINSVDNSEEEIRNGKVKFEAMFKSERVENMPNLKRKLHILNYDISHNLS